MKLKITYLVFLLTGFSHLLFSQIPFAKFTLSNPASIAKNETVVSISWSDLIQRFPSLDTSKMKIIDLSTKKEVAYQLETLGQGSIQNVLVQVSIKPKSKITLGIVKAKPSNFPAKVYARFVPERKDDFAWENDKIAFRAYGKALQGTKEDAYGFDVWAKRTDQMIINKRYKLADYHKDYGDGLDYYKVGYTLGCGNAVPYINDSIWYSGNYQRWKILDKGPLRTTFVLEHDTWNANGTKVNVIKTISLDAGSQLNKMKMHFEFDSESLPVVIGLVRRVDPGTVMMAEQQGILAYWEPEHGEDGISGVGVIYPNGKSKMFTRKNQILAQTILDKTGNLEYYMGSAWNKAGKIINASQWNQYLMDFKLNLDSPVQISFL
ncbi:MAG: DUF4861 family protein [Leadbetterella sp.]